MTHHQTSHPRTWGPCWVNNKLTKRFEKKINFRLPLRNFGLPPKCRFEKNQTNATNVTMHPLRQDIWEHIWQHTVEKSQTSAVNVNFDPVLQTLWRPISKYTVEKSQTNATNVILYRFVREFWVWRVLFWIPQLVLSTRAASFNRSSTCPWDYKIKGLARHRNSKTNFHFSR